jgi:serine/threonine protein kinase
MGCNSSKAALDAKTSHHNHHMEYSFHENLVRDRTGHGRHRFNELYEVLEDIGHGGISTIYKIRKRQQPVGGSARSLTRGNSWRRWQPEAFKRPDKSLQPRQQMTRDSLFALKVIDLSLVPGDKVEQLKNEVEILKRLDHKNIIRGRRKVRC